MAHQTPPRLTLGKIRAWLISAAAAVVVLRIVIWAILPLWPYLLSGVVLTTVVGIALYRSNHF